jgi:hypothetical protein
LNSLTEFWYNWHDSSREWEKQILLNAQVLALALIPLLSGAVPRDGVMVSPMSLLGIEEHVTADFLVGTWKCSDEFFRWGVTDKEKSTVKSFRGQALMSLTKDGEIKMTNFFRPAEARWELSSDRLIVYDQKFPERSPQALPVRKRDKDKIWILLPFTGGSAGIGMVRVENEATTSVKPAAATHPAKQRKILDPSHDSMAVQRTKEKSSGDSEKATNDTDFLIITPTKQDDSF